MAIQSSSSGLACFGTVYPEQSMLLESLPPQPTATTSTSGAKNFNTPILQYTIFEQLKNLLEKRRRITPKDAFVLGVISKLLATTITYPYITVKSRAHVATKGSPREGMVQSLRKIFENEGWMGLYNGIGPKVSQSVLTAAFLFAFKDVLYNLTVAARRKTKALKI